MGQIELIPVLKQAVHQAGTAVSDLILPPACRLCDCEVGTSRDFCRTCERALTLSESWMKKACRRCGTPSIRRSGIPSVRSSETPIQRSSQAGTEEIAPEPVVSKAESTDSRATVLRGTKVEDPFPADFERCPHCMDLSLRFSEAVALWAYENRVCEAVVAAKYAHRTALADALGRNLGRRLLEAPLRESPDFVTYIPSHLTRQFSRGGNGNRLLAFAVARMLSKRCLLPLKTSRRIKKQAWLDDAERVHNVRGAFSLKKSYDLTRSRQITDKHFLIVDDVLTTGATANEVAQVLRTAGARRVSLAVVARAIRSNR